MAQSSVDTGWQQYLDQVDSDLPGGVVAARHPAYRSNADPDNRNQPVHPQNDPVVQ